MGIWYINFALYIIVFPPFACSSGNVVIDNIIHHACTEADNMRSKVVSLAAALYVVATYMSLRRSSEPTEPCGQGDDRKSCLRPLVTAEDRLSVELWALEENETSSSGGIRSSRTGSRRRAYRWPIDSCRQGLSFAMSDSRTVFDAKNGNCTLELPAYSRRRGQDGGKPMEAFLVLKRTSDGLVVAEAPFELTRMVEIKQRSEIISVPHFKYRADPIVLRVVADEQLYGLPAIRGDGVSMQRHPDEPSGRYRPLVYVDDVSLRHSSQIEIGESGEGRPALTVRIRVSVISPMRDAVYQQVTLGMGMAESILHESDLDEIRYLINDDYIYRFVLTQTISFLHVWLDYLAFRDEIGFYVGKTDMGGLSRSSVVSRFICSLIIFLYLLEGGGTSWLVLFSIGSGLSAEGWKAWKVLKLGLSSTFPFVTFRADSHLSTVEKMTTALDAIARTYLSLVLYPMIVGSAVYASRYYTYKSWWSWLISNLANAVYTYGFVGLCPQLYINYRLKSVAHMPWKCFVYKIFNTFVDDVFAVLIEMPMKHRLMTLRDDLVFIILLVQMYVYRVDKKRVNEYGFAYDDGGAHVGDGASQGEEKIALEER